MRPTDRAEARAVEHQLHRDVRAPDGVPGQRPPRHGPWSVRAVENPWNVRGGRYTVTVDGATPRRGDPFAARCHCPWATVDGGVCRHVAAVGRWLEARGAVSWRPAGPWAWVWVDAPAPAPVEPTPGDPFTGLS